jgi:acetyl esterase/lipase
MVGVNMTYRLAPQHLWPAGAADIGSVVGWLRQHAAEHGADSDRIFLLGTSAGAVHVASYIAHPQFHPASSPAAAGAIMAGEQGAAAIRDRRAGARGFRAPGVAADRRLYGSPRALAAVRPPDGPQPFHGDAAPQHRDDYLAGQILDLVRSASGA